MRSVDRIVDNFWTNGKKWLQSVIIHESSEVCQCFLHYPHWIRSMMRWWIGTLHSFWDSSVPKHQPKFGTLLRISRSKYSSLGTDWQVLKNYLIKGLHTISRIPYSSSGKGSMVSVIRIEVKHCPDCVHFILLLRKSFPLDFLAKNTQIRYELL